MEPYAFIFANLFTQSQVKRRMTHLQIRDWCRYLLLHFFSDLLSYGQEFQSLSDRVSYLQYYPIPGMFYSAMYISFS
jgi:hypothetical protein